MPPPRMFQRRRRQLFALMGQPLFPFLAVLLLAAQCCSAQPHAREDHAQHIMNQARANQKASRPVCAILASAAARDLPRRHRAVKDVASMAYEDAASPTRELHTQAHEAAARVAAPETRRRKKSDEGRQLEGPAPGAQGPPQAQAGPGEAQEGAGSKEAKCL